MSHCVLPINLLHNCPKPHWTYWTIVTIYMYIYIYMYISPCPDSMNQLASCMFVTCVLHKCTCLQSPYLCTQTLYIFHIPMYIYICIYVYIHVSIMHVRYTRTCTCMDMYMYIHAVIFKPPIYNHVDVYVFSHVVIRVSTRSHVGWGLHSCGQTSRPDHGFGLI